MKQLLNFILKHLKKIIILIVGIRNLGIHLTDQKSKVESVDLLVKLSSKDSFSLMGQIYQEQGSTKL